MSESERAKSETGEPVESPHPRADDLSEVSCECQECGAIFLTDEDGFDAEECIECGGELIEVVG